MNALRFPIGRLVVGIVGGWWSNLRFVTWLRRHSRIEATFSCARGFLVCFSFMALHLFDRITVRECRMFR